MTDINDLKARIDKYGIVRPNRYQVELSPPQRIIDLMGGDLKERLVIQCETAQLPGKSFSTQEHRIYGPLTKFPYVPTFTNSIDLTFRVSTDFQERTIFDVWQGLIMDPRTNMFAYLREYATEFVVHQFDQEDNRLYSVKLLETYPEAIQPIELSAEARDSYVRQTITFAFRRWEPTRDVPLTLQSTTSEKKSESGFVETYLTRAAFAFYDQLPRITGSGGTLFGSVLR